MFTFLTVVDSSTYKDLYFASLMILPFLAWLSFLSARNVAYPAAVRLCSLWSRTLKGRRWWRWYCVNLITYVDWHFSHWWLYLHNPHLSCIMQNYATQPNNWSSPAVKAGQWLWSTPGSPGGGCTSRKSGGGSSQHIWFGVKSQIQQQLSTHTIIINNLCIPVKYVLCSQTIEISVTNVSLII